LALAWLLGKLRRRKGPVLVLSLGALLAFVLGFSRLQGYWGTLLLAGADLSQSFRTAFPPFYAFAASVWEASAPETFRLFLWAALPFTAAVLPLAAGYRQILTRPRAARAAAQTRPAAPRSPLAALFRKELARYWSKPVVVLNSSAGSLMALIGAGALLATRGGILAGLGPLGPAGPLGLARGGLAGICAAALVLAASCNNLAASLISLEGRHLWIRKTLPVSGEVALEAKILAHLAVSAPPFLCASLCAGLAAARSPWDWLVLLLTPQTFLALTATGGLALNLKLPQLEWLNEIHVVKQGASAMLALLGGIGLALLLAGLYMPLAPLVPLRVFLGACALLFAAGAAAVYGWLMGSGVRRYGGLG
jgi:ABC-2 type transport system permease protein